MNGPISALSRQARPRKDSRPGLRRLATDAVEVERELTSQELVDRRWLFRRSPSRPVVRQSIAELDAGVGGLEWISSLVYPFSLTSFEGHLVAAQRRLAKELIRLVQFPAMRSQEGSSASPWPGRLPRSR